MADSEEVPLGANHPTLGPFVRTMHTVVNGPVYWFREKVTGMRTGEANAWYHRSLQRVPGIETCHSSDIVCREEANQQYKRDQTVEIEIVSLLRNRLNDCVFYEKGTGTGHMQVDVHEIIDLSEGSRHPCKALSDAYEKAGKNYFIKHGELGVHGRAENALMKQKHRLMWERRHGEVGTGMKEAAPEA